MPITNWGAAVGSKIEVPTVDGSAIIRIPPGTQSGSVFRMRNRGAPSLIQPGLRGDQFVEVKVAVPQIADERSKDILALHLFHPLPHIQNHFHSRKIDPKISRQAENQL